jgi:small conductance mechanosensitive channel
MTRLLRLLLVLPIVLFAAFVLPSSAQQTFTPPGAATTTETDKPSLTPQEAARALIGILENDASRAQLIGELGRIAAPAGGAVSPPATTEPSIPVVTDTTFARELGLYTESIAKDFTEILMRVWIRLSHVASVLTGAATVNWPTAQDLALALGLLLAVGFGVLWSARWVARWPLDRLSTAAENRTPAYRVLLGAVAAVVEFACLAVATAAVMLTITILNSDGEIGVVERHFSNAFTLVETVKIVLRLIFSPRSPSLRIPPITDAVARHWSYWLSRIADLLGYGVVLGVPIVTESVSFAVALGFRMLIAITALVGFGALVIYNRARVRAGMVQVATQTGSVTLTTTLSLLAPVWHLIAIGYALVAFAVWITRPLDAIGYMVSATLQSAVTVVVGGGLMALTSRAIAGGIRLPADVKAALPLLENRLNLLIPTILRVLRLAVGVVLVAGVLQAWQLIDVFDWARTERGADTLGRITAAAMIVLVAMVIWIGATSWIEYRLNPGAGFVSTPRARTLLTLFRNAFTIAITVIGVMLALSELGVDIAPLIAGAGVLGLAIGFGSQKLVQDIINGAFIQFENAMNVGDVVTVAGTSGVVEKLTIRSVGLRDVNGVYHIIPFSSVDSVSNSMRGFAFHVADLRVSRDDDIDTVKALMSEAFDRLMKTPHQADVLEPLEMNGVVGFADGTMTIRGRIKTLPGRQWGVGRAYSEIVKTVFNQNGIPFPTGPAPIAVQTVIPDPASVVRGEDGEDEDGSEPAPTRPARATRRGAREAATS